MADAPIPLIAPDGRVFAYACPRCLEVRASVTFCVNDAEGIAARAEASLEQAQRCCLCRRCGCETSKWNGIVCAPCREKQTQERDSSPEYQAYLQASAAASRTFETSPDPDAARSLSELMSDISEDHWCAGWMNGTELKLWSMVNGGSRYWNGDVSERRVNRLRELSEQCGGWVIYGKGGEEFVPMDEWLQRGSDSD